MTTRRACPASRFARSALALLALCGTAGSLPQTAPLPQPLPPPTESPPIGVTPAETIYIRGNIYTVDARHPRAEAFAVAGGRFIRVGSEDDVRPLRGDETRIVDLAGRTVLPGLIDAHAHLAGLGSFGMGRLDLADAKSLDEVVAAVRRRIAESGAGEWILGGRWDHESWPERALPQHAALSAASPDHPVWLRRVDGHAGLANAAAMRAAGVTRDTAAPDGGEILRDSDGEPTGVFLDKAMGLIEEHVRGGGQDPYELVRTAQRMCLAVGLTGVHDAGVSPGEVQLYRELEQRGELKLRVYAMISAPHVFTYFREHGTIVGERLTVRSCKLYADGALGSRGAWLLEPYSDQPADGEGRGWTGLSITRPEWIRRACDEALQRGFQVCTHAIGDRGNRETLDAYAAALAERPTADHRFRIEHAQLLSPEDLPRLAQLGVIASMQPTHCTSDMRWVEQRVGPERARGAYAWSSLLRSGARLAAGSDFPVESHNPFLGLYAAVTRQTVDGQPAGGWRPEERLTREEALRAFTMGAAYAAFEEQQKGSISPGKLADFIVIDRDVMTCAPREIVDTRVLRTVIGGEVVYEAP